MFVINKHDERTRSAITKCGKWNLFMQRIRSCKWEFMDERQKLYNHHNHVEPSMLLIGLVYRDLPGKKILEKQRNPKRNEKMKTDTVIRNIWRTVFFQICFYWMRVTVNFKNKKLQDKFLLKKCYLFCLELQTFEILKNQMPFSSHNICHPYFWHSQFLWQAVGIIGKFSIHIFWKLNLKKALRKYQLLLYYSF